LQKNTIRLPIKYFTELTDPRIVKVDGKSNEITAIPKLLEVPALQGCTVTPDAMGCQKEIAEKIIKKGADCIPAVKGNQECLEEDVKLTERFCFPTGEWVDEDFGHGRIENRKCSLYKDLTFIENAAEWKELKTVIKIGKQGRKK
jgi:hypothetical protein